MAHLFDTFWFEPGSRMTGMFTARAATEADADVVVLATQVQLGRDQDGSVECDFLQSLLPFSCGGFHGVGPDRDPWVVLLQIAPATAASLVGADDPAWPMVDAMDRALRFNPEAQVQDEARWTRSDLLDIYEQAWRRTGAVADWPTADLLHGLLAECCYVPLEQVVAGRLTQCAFPTWTTNASTTSSATSSPCGRRDNSPRRRSHRPRPSFPPTRPRGNTVEGRAGRRASSAR